MMAFQKVLPSVKTVRNHITVDSLTSRNLIFPVKPNTPGRAQSSG